MKRMTVVTFLVLLTFGGCGPSGQKRILGKWKTSSDTATMTFLADGCVTIAGKGTDDLMPGVKKYLLTGKYVVRNVSKRKEVQIELLGLNEHLRSLWGTDLPVVCNISLEKRELALLTQHGASTFVKVNE